MRNPYKAKKITSCSNCKFWERHEMQKDVGYCNRYPPEPVKGNLAIIRLTNEDYWCGEHSPTKLPQRG